MVCKPYRYVNLRKYYIWSTPLQLRSPTCRLEEYLPEKEGCSGGKVIHPLVDYHNNIRKKYTSKPRWNSG